MKPAIPLICTKIGRTGDSSRPYQYNRTAEHEERVDAHCVRVQREYFDTGLHYLDQHPSLDRGEDD